MKQTGRWFSAVLVGVLLLGGGCSMMAMRGEQRSGPPKPYAGTKEALPGIVGMPLYYGAGIADNPWLAPVAPLALLFAPVYMIDSMASFVGETAMLPIDSHYRAQRNPNRQFWKGVFLSREPIPSTKAMRQHYDRYMVVDLGRYVGGYGGRVSGQEAYYRQLPAQCDWVARDRLLAELVTERARRDTLFERLLEAEIGLAGIAGWHGLSPEQLTQLMPYAKGRRDVRLALIGNPGTPPDCLARLTAFADGGMPEALAQNPALSAEQYERLLQEGEPETLLALAGNPALPQPMVLALAKRGPEAVRRALAERSDLADECARQLVREAGAASRLLRPNGRRDLPADVLRAAIASQPPHSTQRQYALRALRSQHHAPPDLLETAWREGALTAGEAAATRNLPPGVLVAITKQVVADSSLDLDVVEALVPRADRESLLALHGRLRVEWVRVSTSKDKALRDRHRTLAGRVDARLKALRGE